MTEKLKSCSSCKQEIPENAKFCTKCGAKQVENFDIAEEKPDLKCDCGSELLPTAKFCTKCGKKVEQKIESKANLCSCGAELVSNAKFCTKCGKNLGVQIPKENMCVCGSQLMPNAKFCTKCGQQVGVKPALILGPKKPSKKRRNRFIAAAAVLLVLLGATYFVFFFNHGIKKTLLASYEILPNDSTETVISYNDEVTISIPPGTFTQKDSLHLYGVTNIDAPEFADDIVRTYDFDFQNTDKFSKEVEVSFSYKNDIEAGQSVNIMYYNEETEEWEDAEALINEQNQSIRVFRSHFSCLGMVSHTSTPGPMMKVYAMKDPATMNYANDYSKAQDIIQAYGEKKKPDQTAVNDGVDFFLTSFDITSLATDFHEKIFKYERFAKFNNIAGTVSIINSTVTLGIELGREKYIDAIMNVTKTAAGIGLSIAAPEIAVLYNAAVFLYDLYSAKLEEEASELEFQEYWADYYRFNSEANPYRKSGAEWTQFIKDNIKTSVDFEWTLEQELKNYVSAYFDVNHTIPDNIKEPIMQHESLRMRGEIKAAVLRYVNEMKAEQEREMIRQMFAMRDELNGIAMIQVMVYGKEEGSKAVRGLPVRIVVDKDQELWSGETDRGGQLMFNCTWLGYFHYGEPKVVEVDYDGKTYTGNIDFSSSNLSIVSIYIDEDEDDQPAEDVFSFSSIAGTYSAFCNDYTSFMKDENGQWIEYDDQTTDGCGYRNLELVVDKNGFVNVSVKDTKKQDYLGPDFDYCESWYTGEGKFSLKDNNAPYAEISLKYNSSCKPVDETTRKLQDVLINGVYTMEIQSEAGVMKVQYTEIINFGTDFKQIMYFDAVK